MPDEPQHSIDGNLLNMDDLDDIVNPATPSVNVPSDDAQQEAFPGLDIEPQKEERTPRSPKKRKKKKTKRSKKSNIPDFDSMSQEEYLQRKNELLAQLSSFQRDYPDYGFRVPERTESCLELYMYKQECIQQIIVHECVNKYTGYLMLLWVGLEAFATYVLGIDASGFAELQIANLYNYRRSLIEIGERKKHQEGGSGGGGSAWSPEVTLFVQSMIYLGVMVAVNYLFGNQNKETKKQMHKQIISAFNGDNAEEQSEGGGGNGLQGILGNLLQGGNIGNIGNLLGAFMGNGGGQQQQEQLYDE